MRRSTAPSRVVLVADAYEVPRDRKRKYTNNMTDEERRQKSNPYQKQQQQRQEEEGEKEGEEEGEEER